jgi:hypothetical protein
VSPSTPVVSILSRTRSPHLSRALMLQALRLPLLFPMCQ